MKVSCPEEIAFRKGFIGESQLRELAKKFPNEYGEYLVDVADGRV